MFDRGFVQVAGEDNFVCGVVGAFHKVSGKYLALYVAEFQFRYNSRGNADIFGAVIGGC
jgi:hypothetical protein